MDNNLILMSKLVPPKLGAWNIDRSNIHSYLQNLPWNILLVEAPAGFGKTHLARQISIHSGRPLLWYQLDTFDNELPGFLQYITSGLTQLNTSFSQKFVQGKYINSSQPELMVRYLLNGIVHNFPHLPLLVLDDYHFINNSLVHKIITELALNMPDDMKLVITGRRLPDFHLERLYTQGKLLRLDSTHLRFSRDELCMYLQGTQVEASDSLIDAMEDQTQGWAAAVFMMTQFSIQNHRDQQFTSASLFSYMAGELLDDLSQDIRNFLLNTSVLEVLRPACCDELLQRSDSMSMLQELESRQFFIYRHNDEDSFHLHQMFREFLLDTLGDTRDTWLLRAARVLENHGDYQQAVEHYLQVGCKKEAVRLILQYAKEMILYGRWQTLSYWLEQLDREYLMNEPWLSLYMAEVQLYYGNLHIAEVWLNRSQEIFTSISDDIGQAECYSMRSRLLRSRGHYQESLQQMDKAMDSLVHGERFDLPTEKAFTLLLAGQFSDAEDVLTRTLQTAQSCCDNNLIAYTSGCLGHLYYVMGEHNRAMELYHKAEHISPEPLYSLHCQRHSLAAIYQDWGHLDKALEIAKQSVEVKEKFELRDTLPYAYSQLGHVYIDLGDLKQGEYYYRKAIDTGESIGGEKFFVTLARMFLARCLFQRKAFLKGFHEAHKAMDEARQQGGYILALCQVLTGLMYLHMHKTGEAEKHLQQANNVLQNIKSKYFLALSYGGLARIALDRGQRKEALHLTEKFISLAARECYLQICVVLYNVFRPVLKLASQNNLEPLFVYLVQERIQQIGPADLRTKKKALLKLWFSFNSPEEESGVDDYGEKAYEFENNNTYALLELKLFGTFRLFYNNEDVTRECFGSTRSRDMLAYLAHMGTPVSKDRIIEDLWPLSKSENLNDVFHSTLYQLRKSLKTLCGPQEFVIYKNGLYQLHSQLFSIDRVWFDAFKCYNLLKPHLLEDSEVNRLELALILYENEYLKDLDYIWVTARRDYYQQMGFEIRKKLGSYYLEKGEMIKALDHLLLMQEANPLSEDVHSLLMKVYKQSGDREAVRRQYELYCELMKQELALPPSNKMQEIYADLCNV